MPERPPGALRPGRWLSATAVAITLASCVLVPSPTPSSSATLSPSPSATALPSVSGSTESVEPTATPDPPLSLALPQRQDSRRIGVRVDPNVSADGGGEIEVIVENLSDRNVHELVLRWNTELDQTLFLAPFRPSQQRIADGGPPLVQMWSKWVRGPGERGEPAGTTSLGWGPLLEGGTLTIPILVTRTGPGEVAFDLQILSTESILTLQGGEPAELRVNVP